MYKTIGIHCGFSRDFHLLLKNIHDKLAKLKGFTDFMVKNKYL